MTTPTSTLYQIDHDGDLALFVRTGTTLPVLIDTACWTEYPGDWHPTYLTEQARKTLEAAGHTVTLKQYDATGTVDRNGDDFEDVDTFAAWLETAIAEAGSDEPITTLPEDD